MRLAILASALLFATPVFACPMESQTDYQAAAEKVHAAEGTKVTLKVEGMHCGSCSQKISTALAAIAGVNAAASDYQTGKTEVAFDAAKVKVDALISAIKELGFKASVAQN